jgi:hypothetical protein
MPYVYVQIKYNTLTNILTVSSFQNFTFYTLKLRWETNHTTGTASEQCKLCQSVLSARRFQLSHTTLRLQHLRSYINKLFLIMIWLLHIIIPQFWFLIKRTQQYDELLLTAFNIGGWGTVFGVATGYMLEDSGFESQLRRNFFYPSYRYLYPPSVPCYNGFCVSLPGGGGKSDGPWHWPPFPLFVSKLKKV